MAHRMSFGRRLFVTANYMFLTLVSALCLLPLLHVLAVSFSSGSAAAAGAVILWPVEFTLAAYENVFYKPQYLTAFLISVERVALGTAVNMLLTILIAYPLSKEKHQFRWRTAYAWFFVLTILFNGGLIPWYMTIRATGLIDTIWALILPGAVPVFNVIVLLNFFRGLPKELEESAKMDGAGPFKILWRIYVPLSTPALATLTLFSIVGHWNSWFDGLILMNRPENYPLQSFLQTIIIQSDFRFLTSEEVELMAKLSDRSSRAAQIFVASFPMLVVYPFLQKYFMKGIVLGSVKE